MTLGIAFILILLVAVATGGVSYARAARLRTDGRLHSLPAYHATHAVLWILAPALLVLAAWVPMQTRLVDQAVLATPEGQALPDIEMQRDTILAEARQIANREIEAGFNPESTAILQLRGAGGQVLVRGPGDLDETVSIPAGGSTEVVVREPGLVSLRVGSRTQTLWAEPYTKLKVQL